MNALPLALWSGGVFLLSWVGVLVMRRQAARLGFIDTPNARSSHKLPTARAGGVAFVAVTTVAFPLANWSLGGTVPARYWLLLASGLFIAAVSLVDDRFGLPVRVRFAAHLLGAVVVLLGGSVLVDIQWQEGWTLSLGWLAAPVSILWIVGVTNIYNFMDGIDGIAAGQAVVAASAVAWIAMARGDGNLALLSIILAAAVLGFLAHNWPPARIFMGDVGSAFLGFTFAGLTLLTEGSVGGPVPFLAWVILLAPFLFDSGLTLVRRVLRGERWYEAHREHLYQRLVRAGWSHLAVTSIYLATDVWLAALVVAHFVYGTGTPQLLLAAVVVPLISLLGLVKLVEAQRPQVAGQ